MAEKLQKMKERVDLLNEASKAYYQENREIMSNIEFDKLYDELLEMERETGVVLSNSPTVRVGYELVSSLPKERHEKVMLSLDKTKDVSALKDWLGNQRGILSWKLDGLTIVLTYENGKLQKAVTRGNGEVGEVITNNARVFTNLPLNIGFKGQLILRGEAVISYSDFEKINSEIQDVEAKYKNPRNLCSGSVRQLNNKITAARRVKFFAFSVVKAAGLQEIDFGNSRQKQLEWLASQGFAVVDYKVVDGQQVEEAVDWFAQAVAKNDLPSDGLVLTFDDIAYGDGLGTTAKFPRDSIAFKWRDEIKETKLLEIEWSASRTGLINPIAIFEPVELEGTTVTRASLHNLSIMEGLELGMGDLISVYKANMIIPQVSENLTRSGMAEIPHHCPVCQSETRVKEENDVKSLYCPNEDCLAKHVKSFTHFVSRDAIGIDGLSEATVEKFIAKGFIGEYSDIFHIHNHREEIVTMEGFGEKSYENLIKAIEKARQTTPVRLLYSLGIPNIGLSNAKAICKHFKNNWQAIQGATHDELATIYGVGVIMAKTYVDFFEKEKNRQILADLLQVISFETVVESSEAAPLFEGETFVITGSLETFKNRNELKERIEAGGGKVTDSVTAKTTYLINNDILSGSSKNKKAKDLDVPIITEKQFSEWLESGEKPE